MSDQPRGETTHTSSRALRPPIPVQLVLVPYDTARRQYWWITSVPVGLDTELVDGAARIVTNYNKLPTGVGSDLLRQHYLEDVQAACVVEAALANLKGISK